ncbi:N-acetyl-gamma-glutamyl-phosphate reductase [Brenneria goodwinii]|uniref:N-acetyl-gamma-glutamyl-phosphate reductase n=1 Tax=Brenneria goodwinii TaxID=1109412 RepID=A0A0G4JTW1_9GAMM|nr:N-acetyl-gamma-glutamyl-phosphate reductase [Brenneria goodwinii]
MPNRLIAGAGGYSGAELARYLNRRPQMNITALAVSTQSVDAGTLICASHPRLQGIIDRPCASSMGFFWQ